jgi:hypothetical protein
MMTSRLRRAEAPQPFGGTDMRAHHLVLTLAVTTMCFANDDIDQSRLMLFVDTTASTNQYAATTKLASDLLHKGRDYDRIALYPVGSLGQSPPPIFDEPVAEHVTQRRLQLMRWDLLLAKKLASYKNDRHTCLLDAVQFAAGQLPAMELTAKSHVDLVLISDMIEDCQSSPMGPGVRLDKRSVKRETELVRHLPTTLIRLPQMHVYIVMPPGSGAGPNDARLQDVDDFWRAFLGRCGLRPQDVTITIGSLPAALLQD